MDSTRMAVGWIRILLLLSLAACTNAGPPASVAPQATPGGQPAVPTSQPGVPPPLPPSEVTFIRENTGKLCLEPSRGSVQPVWYPADAIAGCSLEVQRLADTRFDGQARTVRFYTRHVYIDPLGPRSGHVCLAGSRDFSPMQLDRVGGYTAPGTYTLWWGNTNMGDIALGAGQAISQTICFEQH